MKVFNEKNIPNKRISRKMRPQKLTMLKFKATYHKEIPDIIVENKTINVNTFCLSFLYFYFHKT